jgi:hypothetical protein
MATPFWGLHMDDGRERRVLRLAARQRGVVSRAQVLGEGMTRRQIDRRRERGVWTSIRPGVYRIEGSRRDWMQEVVATFLWAGPDAVISHQTAAALWGLGTFGEASPVHVTVGSALPPPPAVVAHRARLRPRDVVTLNGLRVTSVLRTLLDLSMTENEADVVRAVDSALAKKRIVVDDLRRFVDRHPRHPGIALLRRLLHAYEGGDGPVESELEARVLEVIDAAGVPRPVKQRTVRLGGARHRLDFVFPGTKVVIEADGFAWHAHPLSFEKDRARANALAARGYVVLHWTWAALEERPSQLISELVHALEAPQWRAA